MTIQNEQIKALAKTICSSMEAQSYCKDCYGFDKCRAAQVLYEAGYRRVPEAQRTIHIGSRHICSNCGGLTYMENYCSGCGARVLDKENTNE